VNRLLPRPRQKDSLANAQSTKKARYGISDDAFWRHRICETVKLCLERALKTLGLRRISHSSTVSQCFFSAQGGALGRSAHDAGVVAGAVADCGGDVSWIHFLDGRR